MPALAPEDKLLEHCDVLVRLEDEVEFDRISEVVVAMFQPSNWTAFIVVEELIASVADAPESTRYVMIWPDVNGDLHVPTALPGSPF